MVLKVIVQPVQETAATTEMKDSAKDDEDFYDGETMILGQGSQPDTEMKPEDLPEPSLYDLFGEEDGPPAHEGEGEGDGEVKEGEVKGDGDMKDAQQPAELQPPNNGGGPHEKPAKSAKELSEEQKERKRVNSRAWHKKWISKGVPREEPKEDDEEPNAEPNHEEPHAEPNHEEPNVEPNHEEPNVEPNVEPNHDDGEPKPNHDDDDAEPKPGHDDDAEPKPNHVEPNAEPKNGEVGGFTPDNASLAAAVAGDMRKTRIHFINAWVEWKKKYGCEENFEGGMKKLREMGNKAWMDSELRAQMMAGRAAILY